MNWDLINRGLLEELEKFKVGLIFRLLSLVAE